MSNHVMGAITLLVLLSLATWPRVARACLALVLPNGGWLVTPATAVNRMDAVIAMRTGDADSIQVVSGPGSAVKSTESRSLDQAQLMKQTLVVH